MLTYAETRAVDDMLLALQPVRFLLVYLLLAKLNLCC
jgi:hypothetical protein